MCSNDKSEGLNVRGRPLRKEGTSWRNSNSNSRGHKSNKFCKYCMKRGSLVDECYSLKNKKDKREKNKQSQKSFETSIVNCESGGDLLCVTTNNNRCTVDFILNSGCTYHQGFKTRLFHLGTTLLTRKYTWTNRKTSRNWSELRFIVDWPRWCGNNVMRAHNSD